MQDGLEFCRSRGHRAPAGRARLLPQQQDEAGSTADGAASGSKSSNRGPEKQSKKKRSSKDRAPDKADAPMLLEKGKGTDASDVGDGVAIVATPASGGGRWVHVPA